MPLSPLFDGYATPDAAERASILIVDDLPEKLLVFETILADLDQHLVIARSGSEALREVLRQQFAVILMDVNMPGIDGLETARLIRGYRRSAHTPIIFVTAYADELQTAQGYSLGAVDYILSPVIPDVLRSKVRVFVDLFIMQQRLRQQALERIAIARAEAAQRAAEENTRRSIFLAQAGRELADSLDADVAMRRLLALLVPRFAPRALLWLRDAGHGHERVLRCDAPIAAGEPPLFTEGREQMLSEVLYNATRNALEQMIPALQPGALPSPPPLPPAVPTALPAFAPSGLPGDDAAVARMPLRRDTASGVVLPLVAGERALGGLLLSEPHQPPDWPTLEELAGRAAIAFENARLYGALQAEIVERRQVEAELLEASRRKDEFLAMLSHELRNPLAPIRNAIEVMRTLLASEDALPQDRTPDRTPDRGQGRDRRLAEAVSVTDRQAKHLTRLVDELLDVARISQGKIVLKTELLDLRDVVRQAVEPVQSLIDAQGQQLQLQLPDRPARVRGDAARLIQVVTNLLHNASKYTEPEGHISLTLTQALPGDGSAALGDGGAGGAFTVSVRDNGRGIAASLLPHVFDLFEQGPRSLDRNQGGLGVGLTLVQRLVQLHHGRVEAHSDGPGCGSEFIVRLPAAPAEDAALPSPAPVAPTVRSAAVRPSADDEVACRVMVVDDNRDAADSMAVFLDLAGFETQVQLDGSAALEAATRQLPQVVLLDIGLPGLDGYEVARRLRGLPGGDRCLLIALTGYGQQDDRRRAHEAGFDVHLVKPADPDAVVELVQEWRHRERAAARAETAAR
ncbi:response regulator [Roseateles sp. MS654]|uniref:response regulator n=1 Tax=Roseateles sp. MS654 TaxID=3412685 RepID=UPI003C2F50A0